MGVYLLATGLSSLWRFIEFGVSHATIKFVAEDIANGNPQAAANIISTALVYYALIGVAGALAIWFLAPSLVYLFSVSEAVVDDAEWAFRLAGLRFAAFFITTVFISVFKGLHWFEYAMAVLSVLQVVTFGGALLGILVADAGLVGISLIGMVANIAMLILAAIAAITVCRAHGIHLSAGQPSVSVFRRMIAYGAFLALNGISSSLIQLLQSALVAALLGPGGVTIFSIGAMIWQRANRTFAALFEFMVPATSALSKDLIDENTRRDTERRLRRLYLRAFAVSGFLSISAAAVLYVIAPYIEHLWLNSEIDDEVTLLIRLFCPAIAAIGLVRPGYHMLNGLGRPHLNTIFRLSNLAAVYVILGILWVNGLVLEDFAIAQSGATILYAAAFVTFMEMIVWRNWIGRRKNLARPNPAKDTGDE